MYVIVGMRGIVIVHVIVGVSGMVSVSVIVIVGVSVIGSASYCYCGHYC